MDEHEPQQATHSKAAIITATLVVLLLAAAEVLAFTYLFRENNSLEQNVAALRSDHASTTTHLEEELYILENALYDVTTQNVSLEDALQAERDRVEDLREQVGDFERSVETLEKLSQTDKQLLQKYSKVYFLNEHYVPSDLAQVDTKYDFPNDREVSVHADMWPHLEDLLEAAWEDDVKLLVLSGYRSFDEQSALKSQYKVTYGAGSANSFSADQGYSEHQLGTTVDFTTAEVGASLAGFQNTLAYAWLKENAYKYGFILSYPENNEQYIFEPWHWRFVGKDLARYIDRRDTTFYQLDQRRIDEYLIDFFD